MSIFASLVLSLRRVAWLTAPQAVIAVEIRDQGRLSVQTVRGEWHDCILSGESYVSPYLTILVLKQNNKRMPRCIVITPYNTDAEEFRQLRVWLRWAAPKLT